VLACAWDHCALPLRNRFPPLGRKSRLTTDFQPKRGQIEPPENEERQWHRQLDWLWSEMLIVRRHALMIMPCDNAADFRPDPETLRSGSSVLGGSDVIAAELKQVDLVAR
jgi:hypothetical protein